MEKERILTPIKRIKTGISLPHFKGTAEKETVAFSPEKVFIPVSMHIGAPCVPTVNVGDSVFVGTVIADSEAAVSAPIHSGVSGTVTAISKKEVGGRATDIIEIESDKKMEKDPNIKPFSVKNQADLIEAAKKCGLVGLGGAGFPTHIKLNPPNSAKIDTLVVNAAECEPYITADYRECMENYNDVIEAIYLIKDIFKLEKVVICVEANKPKAISKLYEIATDKRDKDDTVKLMKLPTKYPQGAEKVIIYSATGRVLPVGKLPSDVGCIVMNVTSLGTLYRFIKTGMPLVSKRITFEGTAVKEPKNVIVPIGTKITDVIDFCGGVDENYSKIITGGPMMGTAVLDEDAVIEKRTNAVLVLNSEKDEKSTPCIRCGRCANKCPMGLTPAKVEAANRIGDTESYEKLNVNLCMECGSCSYVCPAKRPLTQVMRVAKAELRRKK
ncbi:MAG: electron transport complex subunit RsxC [Clostridia bacterium]|nr:electron transport complex subunit RsxC [Clostridia bacterium]